MGSPGPPPSPQSWVSCESGRWLQRKKDYKKQERHDVRRPVPSLSILYKHIFIYNVSTSRQQSYSFGPLLSAPTPRSRMGLVFGCSMILVDVSGNSCITVLCSNYAATAIANKTFMRSEISAVMLRLTPLFSAITPISLVLR